MKAMIVKQTKINRKISKPVEPHIIREISGKQALLMIPLTKFFCQQENIDKILPILNGDSKISLRIIDWYVTNYSKKYNTIYNIKYYRNIESGVVDDDSEDTFLDQFMVYPKYKSQLKAFSKKQFDPFCRRDRICFYYTNTKSIITTVGQLNFFKWAIESYILCHILDNLVEIEDDMNRSMKRVYSGKTQKKNRKFKKDENPTQEKNDKLNIQRKKRRELSIASNRSITYHRHPVCLSFD